MKTFVKESCLLINYNNLGIQETRQSQTSFRHNDLMRCTYNVLYVQRMYNVHTQRNGARYTFLVIDI